jgi:GNAT superfamily N-acetyltransferase
MDSGVSARRAAAADAGRITTIIALAFADDPVWKPALARPGGGTAHHEAMWRPFVDGALRYPATWLTTGGEAVAIWIPPDGTGMTPQQEERAAGLAAEHLGPAAGVYFELLDRIHAAHPRGEPHYFLTLLGTHPGHRGHGFGMRLLAQNLELIDAEHRPAYLESSNPVNDRRYASVGFEPIGEVRCPPDGAVLTTMWRAAR